MITMLVLKPDGLTSIKLPKLKAKAKSEATPKA